MKIKRNPLLITILVIFVLGITFVFVFQKKQDQVTDYSLSLGQSNLSPLEKTMEEAKRRTKTAKQLLEEMKIETPYMDSCGNTKVYRGRGLTFKYGGQYNVDDNDTSSPIFIRMQEKEAMRINYNFVGDRDNNKAQMTIQEFVNLPSDQSIFISPYNTYIDSIIQVNLSNKKIYKIKTVSVTSRGNAFSERTQEIYLDLTPIYYVPEKTYERVTYEKSEIIDNQFYCTINSLKAL